MAVSSSLPGARRSLCENAGTRHSFPRIVASPVTDCVVMYFTRPLACCAMLATVGCSSSSDDHEAAAGGSGGVTGGSGGTLTGGSGGVTGGSGGVTGGSPDCRTTGDGRTSIAFVNHCASTVTFQGSDIVGGDLAPGGFACRDIGSTAEALSSKRYWGYVGADPGGEHYTLAEFTFNTDFNDFDWYNISHVDAHNLPMQIVPVDRPDCHTLTCAQDFLADCPEVGQVLDAAGHVVVCVSPERDNPNSPVALYFEQCDDAYAWSGDDQQGTDTSPMRACAGEDWDIVFCP
jgi:hypothetical protein